MAALWRSRKAATKAEETATSASGRTVQRVRVVSKTVVSDGAMLLHLSAVDPERPLVHFPAGAHIDLHVRPGLVRQYSLVGAPEVRDHYLVCVQREEAGRGGSIAVHDDIADGAHLDVSAPRSTFELVPSASRAILIGGGIGLTPLVSMAEHLHGDGKALEFHVYARTASALPLHDHLASRLWAPSVHRHFSDEGDSFRVSAPRVLSEPDANAAVYICGPEGFIDLACTRASEAGWPADRIVTERFSGSGASVDSGAAFEVVATSTGERMTVAPDESIADVLENHGYETYRSCGQGVCGSCVMSVRAGLPDHRDNFQTDKEHATNGRINVCVSRSLSAVLELDV